MAQFDFYIDVDRQKRVKSKSDASQVSLPPFALGDTYTIRIHALQPTGATIGTVYSPILTAGKTVKFAVGTLGGATHYAEQYTWTGDDSDSNDPFFYADVSFNTAQMVALLNSQTSAKGFLQILIDDGTPKTILLEQVTLESAVILNSTLTVQQGQTWATMETVLALLLNITTDSVTIRSSDRAHSRRLWEDVDGTPHDDQS
jgi:hypothetical protein